MLNNFFFIEPIKRYIQYKFNIAPYIKGHVSLSVSLHYIDCMCKTENIDFISPFHKHPVCILVTLQNTIKNDKVTFL